jgi:integrase/recombinase XerD
LRVLRGLQVSSIGKYRAHVAEFFKWRSGNALDGRLDEITQQDVESYLAFCYYQGNGNQTRLSKLVSLQNFFRYLIYTGIIAADPTANIPRPRADKPLMHTFTREEVLRLFAQVDITREKGIRDVVILIFAAFAGFRLSEIINFNLDHITDDGKDLDLSVIKTKRGENRTVYLWKAPAYFVRQLLAARLADRDARGSDPLIVPYFRNGLPRGNRRLTPSALNRLLKDLTKSAGIRKPTIKLHSLRATHANTLQHIRGYSLPAIQERLGWKDLSTAGRYLVHRERIHHEYKSLHEYWIDFTKTWITKGGDGVEQSLER